MIIFDDIYEWKGPEDACRGCSGYGDNGGPCLITCRLRILDLSASTESPSVAQLKQHVVMAEDLSQGPRRRICAESLGRHIFLQFKLDIRRTLWIEFDPFLKESYHVAQFTPAYHDGLEVVYTINWRTLLPLEKMLLHDHLLQTPLS